MDASVCAVVGNRSHYLRSYLVFCRLPTLSICPEGMERDALPRRDNGNREKRGKEETAGIACIISNHLGIFPSEEGDNADRKKETTGRKQRDRVNREQGTEKTRDREDDRDHERRQRMTTETSWEKEGVAFYTYTLSFAEYVTEKERYGLNFESVYIYPEPNKLNEPAHYSDEICDSCHVEVVWADWEETTREPTVAETYADGYV